MNEIEDQVRKLTLRCRRYCKGRFAEESLYVKQCTPRIPVGGFDRSHVLHGEDVSFQRNIFLIFDDHDDLVDVALSLFLSSASTAGHV